MSFRISFPSDTNLQIFVDKLDASALDDWGVDVDEGEVTMDGEVEDLEQGLIDEIGWLGGNVNYITDGHGRAF